MYRITCSFSGGATAIPTEIIDQYLKLAPAASFKVLLFILRNPDGAADAKQIGLCTGLSQNEAQDYLDFWESKGIVADDSSVRTEKMTEAIGNVKTLPSEKQNTTTKKASVKLPSYGEVIDRLKKDPQFGAINQEAQLIVGTYGSGMQSVLLFLYDYYGFAPEIIITLLQFQKDCGRLSPNDVKKCAEDWNERGIDTIEAVSAELRALQTIDNAYSAVKTLTEQKASSPDSKTAKYLRQWAVEWAFSTEMILLAVKEGGKSYAEANKLLKKWSAQNLTSPEQVNIKTQKNIPQKHERSYDVSKIGKRSILASLEDDDE